MLHCDAMYVNEVVNCVCICLHGLLNLIFLNTKLFSSNIQLDVIVTFVTFCSVFTVFGRKNNLNLLTMLLLTIV